MDWGAVISALAALSGIALGWLGREHSIKKYAKEDGAADGELRASVNYIRQGVDDLKVEIRARGQQFDMLAERVTRVEESSKQAHKRIDRLEGRLEGGDK